MTSQIVLPTNIDAERVVLGSILLDDSRFPEGLASDCFSIEPHRRIWHRMLDLRARGEKIERITVANELQNHGQLQAVGGLTFLISLDDGLPRLPCIESYTRILEEKAARRRIMFGCQGLIDQAADSRDLSAIIAAGQKIFNGGIATAQSAREFAPIGDDRYRLTLPDIGVIFEIDRLRRERNELIGELVVRCELPGAQAINGILSAANFNVSSARARTGRAKLLSDRANIRGLDWPGLLEEFCQRVLQADRAGQPAVDLRDVAKPEAESNFEVDGFKMPRRHPTILFGDGGTGKSYTALWIAGRLAQQGVRVALFDWEFCGGDHRDRLERLFGPTMPQILYARCERPLIFDADRLCRIVRERGVEFAVYDSIAFACDGPPEAAEVASRYFRAVRQIGGGSLHVAHVSKAENGDKKPFGSTFWHNGARSTWYVKLADASADTETLNIGLFNRKANLGRLSAPAAFSITFTKDNQTIFRRSEVAESPDLAGQLSVRQRMAYLLRRGSMAPEAVAEEIEADLETVKRTARRYKRLFTLIDGGRRLGLLEKAGA